MIALPMDNGRVKIIDSSGNRLARVPRNDEVCDRIDSLFVISVMVFLWVVRSVYCFCSLFVLFVRISFCFFPLEYLVSRDLRSCLFSLFHRLIISNVFLFLLTGAAGSQTYGHVCVLGH